MISQGQSTARAAGKSIRPLALFHSGGARGRSPAGRAVASAFGAIEHLYAVRRVSLRMSTASISGRSRATALD